MNPQNYINKFNSGEYTIEKAEEMMKQGYEFTIKTGGVVTDIVYRPEKDTRCKAI